VEALVLPPVRASAPRSLVWPTATVGEPADHVCVGALHLYPFTTWSTTVTSAVSAAVCCHRAHEPPSDGADCAKRPGKRSIPL
jgi:hypothetical protein